MENKYYTPSIEEFHVGFEYEYLEHFGKDFGKWNKYKVEHNSSLFHLSNLLASCSIRVKYLDKEDIESLGFEFGEYSKGRFKNETIELFNKFSTVWVIHAIGSDYRDKLFEGNIKNLSELKVLLKQLGIIES